MNMLNSCGPMVLTEVPNVSSKSDGILPVVSIHDLELPLNLALSIPTFFCKEFGNLGVIQDTHRCTFVEVILTVFI